jgi:hypothetical protein
MCYNYLRKNLNPPHNLGKIMRPKREPEQPQRELFQAELEQMIDLHHRLVCLGMCIDWASFEEALGATYHPTQGAPGISTRLMVALHYLKYQHDLSDENVCRTGWRTPTGSTSAASATFSIAHADRCLQHDALASAAGRGRSRADAARHHRDGDQDGRHPSRATEAHQRGYDGADQGDSLSHRCAALQPLPRAAGEDGAPGRPGDQAEL